MLMICSHRKSKTISKLQWVSKIPCPYVILNGNPDQAEDSIYNEETHVVTLKCRDDYDGLRDKIKAGFRFVKQRFNPDFVFKIDDDVFVDLDKLMQSSKNINCDYAGVSAYYPSCGIYFGGPLYYVSRTGIEALQDMPTDKWTPEDVSVGYCLRNTVRRAFMFYTCHATEGRNAIAFHDHKREFL
jgi:hypothetical protein